MVAFRIGTSGCQNRSVVSRKSEAFVAYYPYQGVTTIRTAPLFGQLLEVRSIAFVDFPLRCGYFWHSEGNWVNKGDAVTLTFADIAATLRQLRRKLSGQCSSSTRPRPNPRRGLGCEALEERIVLAADAPWHFDFGTSVSPVAAGAQRVTERTTFSPSTGFGWSAGSILSADRGTGNALTRDFNYTSDGTFSANVSNGVYQVQMILGDLGGYQHDRVGVYLENSLRDDVSTHAGQVVTRTYQVEVADGTLTLRLRDLGGSDRNAVIESLSIQRVGSVLPSLQVGDARVTEGQDGTRELLFDLRLSNAFDQDIIFDYQTGDGSASSGTDYQSVVGRFILAAGQTTGTVAVTVFGDETGESDETVLLKTNSVTNVRATTMQAVGTIVNDDFPPTLQMNLSVSSFFENAAGTAATGTITRTGATVDAILITLGSSDGSSIDLPTTIEIAAGQTSADFSIAARDNNVFDGSRFVALNATAAGYVAANGTIEVKDDDQPPFLAHFDFGTTGSPLGAGYQRVSERTVYSQALGYGWSAGTIASADRGGDSTTLRDFNYTKDGTFVVNVAPGDYLVDVLLGDVGGYQHDNVAVLLEGAHVDTVTTRAGQVVGRTFLVHVADGQLTLRLADLGGADANAVIEALRVRSANVPVPTSVFWPVQASIPNAVFSEARRDADGFLTYSVSAPSQRTANTIRVLLPDNYDPNKAYQVVYVLPVGPGLDRQFGDGLVTAKSLGLQRSYDVIMVAPSFSDMPWYADNAHDPSIAQESYFRNVVVPFIETQFHTVAGPEGRLLLGFSKSGYGAVSMLLRNPEFFGGAVSWDGPLAMSDPGSGYAFLNILGTRQNFSANYQITNLINTRAAYFAGQPPRLAILGNANSQYLNDSRVVSDALSRAGIASTFTITPPRAHVWAGGWMGDAMQALMALPVPHGMT
ncbi:MAG: hypothetical protein C0483_14845 [Pirellula sp.]|nr:hypothetical protein [Pirellula sp.]